MTTEKSKIKMQNDKAEIKKAPGAARGACGPSPQFCSLHFDFPVGKSVLLVFAF